MVFRAQSCARGCNDVVWFHNPGAVIKGGTALCCPAEDKWEERGRQQRLSGGQAPFCLIARDAALHVTTQETPGEGSGRRAITKKGEVSWEQTQRAKRAGGKWRCLEEVWGSGGKCYPHGSNVYCQCKALSAMFSQMMNNDLYFLNFQWHLKTDQVLYLSIIFT